MTDSKKEGSHILIKSIIDFLPHYIFWKDEDSIFLGCNEAFAKIAGLHSSKDIIGKTDYDLPWAKEESDKYRADDHDVMINKKPKLNIEETQTLPDGNTITLLTSKVPLINQKNKVVGVTCIYTDITNKKIKEIELEKAKNLAIISSNAKSEFIANMSHDIRTPITGVDGLLRELLYTASETQTILQSERLLSLAEYNDLLQTLINRTQQYGEIMQGSVDELLRLCNEILEVVRLDEDKADAPIEAFNLRELITHNVELLRSVATHRNLTLTVKIDEHIPYYLRGLRRYLDRTLLNLISNALKFTKTGGVHVVTSIANGHSTTYKKGDSIHLQIQVIDTGIGIPNDKFELIFDHFSRLTSSYEGNYRGSGLGLYTVKRYIEAMKGKITVESEIGKGTCFTITLPLTAENYADHIYQPIQAPILETTAPVATDLISDIKATGTHILVVEDSLAAAMAVKGELQRLNCAVDIANTGKKGVQRAQNQAYDLILMDVGLPDIDGTIATQQIRSLPETTHAKVPIIGLTGHAGENKKQACLDAGMNEVLIKPAQPLVLQSLLEQFVWAPQKRQEALSTTSKKITAQQTGISALPIIDWPGCKAKYHGNETHAKKILDYCYKELKEIQVTLAAAYQTNDTKTLQKELHRILGGLCYVRTPQLEHALKLFQLAVKATPQDMKKLKKTYTVVQTALQAFWETYEKKAFLND